MIPDSFLNELQYRADIEGVVGGYVALKRSGRMLKGLCPFHGEKSPSFYVYPETQSFYCFGCGAGGSVINFVERAENLSFVDAVKHIASRSGMTMPEEEQDNGTARMKLRVLEANRAAARRFFDNLAGESGKEALEYLRGRGLSPGAIRRFGLGYAPEKWSDLTDYLKGEGFSANELAAANLSSVSKQNNLFDVFRGRIMFPIIDLSGNVIAFGGRRMGEANGPKYLNTNDTPAFKKSRNLYALNIAKGEKSRRIILAEGYMDVIALHQAGFENAVATLGTAMTTDQAQLIKRYADEVIISYDSDEAGRTAAKRASSILDKLGLKIKILTLNGAKDPDEYIKQFGRDKFIRILDSSSTVTEHEINRLKSINDITTAEGKVAFTRAFCSLAADISSGIEADVYITAVANELGISKSAIVSSVEAIKKNKVKQNAKKADRDLHLFTEETPARRDDPSRGVYKRAASAEDKLIRLLMNHPDYVERVMSEMSAKDALTDVNARIFTALFDKIAAKEALSMTTLSAVLDSVAVAHLSRLLTDEGGLMDDGLVEAMDYANTIKQERYKAGRDLSGADDIALKDYINELSQTKKQSRGRKNAGR